MDSAKPAVEGSVPREGIRNEIIVHGAYTNLGRGFMCAGKWNRSIHHLAKISLLIILNANTLYPILTETLKEKDFCR